MRTLFLGGKGGNFGRLGSDYKRSIFKLLKNRVKPAIRTNKIWSVLYIVHIPLTSPQATVISPVYLKRQLVVGGKSNDEMMWAVHEWLYKRPKEFFLEYWNTYKTTEKFIEHYGDYVEEWHYLLTIALINLFGPTTFLRCSLGSAS